MGYNRRSLRDPGLYTPQETEFWQSGLIHVSCRALDDLHSFPDAIDKSEFLNRIERVLSPRRILDPCRRPYPKLDSFANLYAFCVLDNHYHLLFEQLRHGGVKKIMRSLTRSYGDYFNKKFERSGQIFHSPYTSTHVCNASKAREKIAYIHLNHEVQLERYMFSSHDYYAGKRQCDWLASDAGLKLFGGSSEIYSKYLAEYGPRILETKARERDLRGPRPRIQRGPGSHIKLP